MDNIEINEQAIKEYVESISNDKRIEIIKQMDNLLDKLNNVIDKYK